MDEVRSYVRLDLPFV